MFSSTFRHLLLGFFLLFPLSFTAAAGRYEHPSSPPSRRVVVVPSRDEQARIKTLYQKLGLEGKLSHEAFELGVRGYNKISDKRRSVLTIVDFSKPSTEERLFVIDMEQEQLLFSSVCAHGRNSGDNFAQHFSNRVNSRQSSLGFYLTNETYSGSNGYSLRLDGLEIGYNDKARERAIVVHGAKYASEELAKKQGRLGRSSGCPAIPHRLARPIIDAIKDGSVLYIYANNSNYLAHSRLAASDPKQDTPQPDQHID